MSTEQDAAILLLELRVNTAFDKGVDIETRTLQLVGGVDEKMFKRLDAGLSLLESSSKKSITIRLNSFGGYPSDALAIIGRMKASTCKIVVEAYGMVASAATIILAAGEKRRMSEYCQFMTHQSSYEMGGKHKENREIVNRAEKEEEIWASYMAKFSNETAEYWKSLHDTGSDNYLNASECLQLSVIDEIF